MRGDVVLVAAAPPDADAFLVGEEAAPLLLALGTIKCGSSACASTISWAHKKAVRRYSDLGYMIVADGAEVFVVVVVGVLATVAVCASLVLVVVARALLAAAAAAADLATERPR